MLPTVDEPIAAIAVDARDRDAADRAIAEAQAYGATGIEEKDGERGAVSLTVYAPASAADALRAAVAQVLGPAARVGAVEPVTPQDWSSTWREGIEAVVVSPRLALRPSFVDYAAEAGQRVLVIDPGQAFGTGHHASTRLALELVDHALRGGSVIRVLDVGTGSGVLALAAVALGAGWALGCDLDPVAAREAGANARANDLAGHVRIFAGSLAAVRGTHFDLVVANLLSRELRPLLADLAGHLAPGGAAIFSGLLGSERDALLAECSGLGLALVEERSDTDGGERWVALWLQKRALHAPSDTLPAESEVGVE
jgi:ribosomal protein L11 methyltransferase